MHRSVFCQFLFQWIYYYGSNKSTGKETGAVVRFTRFLFGGFTTAAIVIQPDEKLVIAPLCISKIAKARPNSAEWPECTSVQSSSPWLSPPHHKCVPTKLFHIPASLGCTVRVWKNLSKYQFFDRLCVKDIAFQGKYMVIWCDGSFSHRTVMYKHVSKHIYRFPVG